MQRKKEFRIPRKRIAKKENSDIQKRLNDLHAQIRAELAGRTLPDPADAIRKSRIERDKQVLDTLHESYSK